MSNTTLNCFVERYFVHIAFCKNNYMFRPLYRPSSGWSIIPYKVTIQCNIKPDIAREAETCGCSYDMLCEQNNLTTIQFKNVEYNEPTNALLYNKTLI
jgi:hypothetical protein